MAVVSGWSYPKVTRRLKELVDRGWLVEWQTRDHSGRWSETRYGMGLKFGDVEPFKKAEEESHDRREAARDLHATAGEAST